MNYHRYTTGSFRPQVKLIIGLGFFNINCATRITNTHTQALKANQFINNRRNNRSITVMQFKTKYIRAGSIVYWW